METRAGAETLVFLLWAFYRMQCKYSELSLREHMVKFLKEPKDHAVFSHLEEGLCTQKDISAFSL